MDRNLTDQEREKIINFGACSFDAEIMSAVLGWPVVEVQKMMRGGEFLELYKRGAAVAEYLLNVKLFEMAKAGDIKALEKFQAMIKLRKIGAK